MDHPIYRVRSFEKLAPYTLRVRFDDGAERVIDFHQILAGKESDHLAVGRPEGGRSAFRSLDHHGMERVEGPQPQHPLAFGADR